jgi:hypothetical protein
VGRAGQFQEVMRQERQAAAATYRRLLAKETLSANELDELRAAARTLGRSLADIDTDQSLIAELDERARIARRLQRVEKEAAVAASSRKETERRIADEREKFFKKTEAELAAARSEYDRLAAERTRLEEQLRQAEATAIRWEAIIADVAPSELRDRQRAARSRSKLLAQRAREAAARPTRDEIIGTNLADWRGPRPSRLVGAEEGQLNAILAAGGEKPLTAAEIAQHDIEPSQETAREEWRRRRDRERRARPAVGNILQR